MELSRTQQNWQRAERRKAGLCTDCGEREAGWNKDGTSSIRCDDCRKIYANAKGIERSRKAKATPLAFRHVQSEYETYFESPAYRDYECLILGILDASEKPLGTAEIKRTVPDIDHTHLLDTLGRLEAMGLAESFQLGARRGYRKSEPRKRVAITDAVKKKEWDLHKAFLNRCFPTEALQRLA